jgi:hypothetical protein
MKKGVLPFVSVVIIMAVGFTTLTFFLYFALPIIRQTQEGAVWRSAQAVMRELDKTIREVAMEGKGSSREFPLHVEEGTYQVSPDVGTFEWNWVSETGVVEPGMFRRIGNIQINTTGRKKGPVSVQLALVYDRIIIRGTGRFAPGTHRLCVRNLGIEAGKTVVSIDAC